MKKQVNHKLRYQFMLVATAIILLFGVFFGHKQIQYNNGLAGQLLAAVEEQDLSKARLAKLSSQNKDLVSQLKKTIPASLATNLKEQDSKTQLVKSFDSLVQILFERDGITSLNSISISDGSQYTNGVISRNIGLDLTTTQDSLLSLLAQLEGSYLANPDASFFLRIDGLNFNTNPNSEGRLEVNLSLQLFNLDSSSLTQSDE